MELLGRIKDGIILDSKNLGITNFKILDIIKKNFKFQQICVKSDAKCAAIYEKKYGSLKNYEDCIFFCLGTGIGGAVFMGGKLLKSKEYDGFELRTHDN